MKKFYNLKIEKEKLEEHVKRICRSNLKAPCKICIECPFLETILGIMNLYGWKYNKEGIERKIPYFKK